ncbi:STAS domain-containing protein, partial [uncultured Methanobrevibacter sp.]|uniref:STAS domain-containing protein n=1 Tax=uncultured Methanobrevibacter sp. TaxID=253161 RepID=UPI0025E7607E
KKYNGDELTMAVEGRIDTITSQILDKQINDELGKFTSLTIDFSDVEYISSAGLRVLISAQKKLDGDASMRIVNVSDVVNEIFTMSGFDKILKIE